MDYETGSESLTQSSDISSPNRNGSSDVSTLVHYCRRHARGATAASPAFTHVVGEPGEHDRLSFSQLDARARAIAGEIQRRGGVGRPALVVLDPGADYAASLFGCLYARAIAVPIYPPQMLRLQHTLPRLRAIIENADASILLSDRATIGPSLSSLWQMPDAAAIAVDEIDAAAADHWDGRMPTPDDVALLQYTSGSTGTPRGVVLTHRALLSNLAGIVKHIHFEGARSVQWVPPYHDMGLIGGILLPIFHGVETVIISPADFVRNPLLWLRCIDHYNGSSNGAPNFGYELCVRRIKDADCAGLDLSSWKVAVAGAEPVRASTLRRFEEKFARYGFEPTTFCPAYGMAETTVMATGSRLGKPYQTFHVDAQALQLGEIQRVSPHSRRAEPSVDDGGSRRAEPSVDDDGSRRAEPSVDDDGSRRAEPSVDDAGSRPTLELVSSGTPVAGIQYEIVDPNTRHVQPDGRIGEIWVRGGSVASGYWNDPEATAATFGAQLARTTEAIHRTTADAAAKYLRTGDLAARVDGELIVTGRLKELIIVAGRNFYPHDIEQIVQSTSEAFKPDTGTALSIDIGEREEMVVIQELWRPKKFPAHELLQEAVAAIMEQAQVTPHAVVLVRSGSLPKTSSGKLCRTDAKTLFLDGELIEIARWESGVLRAESTPDFQLPATETEKQIASIWSRTLDVETIGREDDFFQLGGESLLVANMLVEISEQFSTSIPLAELFRRPKLKDFSAVVDSHGPHVPAPVAIRSTGSSLTENHALSPAQTRFWLLDQLRQINAFVHVPVSVHLDRPVSRSRLQAVCQVLMDRHPMLRARFVQDGSEVSQTFTDTATVEIQTFAGDTQDPRDFSSRWRDFVTAPMDLHEAPLMRVGLRNMASGGCRIDIVLHHLICDATSLQILLGDLQREFAVEAKGAHARADAAPADTATNESLRYVDFAAWDNASHRRQSHQARLRYWTERLSGMPSELSLPQLREADEKRLSAPSSSTDAPISAIVADAMTKQIERLAQTWNMTPSMVYLTAFQCVLATYSGSDDFGITIPTSNRPSSDLQNIVGCFVNPIIYRARVDREQSVTAAMCQTRTALLADLDHADVPFQDVVAATGSVRDSLRMPLSQVMFLYQPPVPSIKDLGGAKVTAVRPDYSSVTAYDLSLIIQPGPRTEMVLVAGEQISRDLAERFLASLHGVLHQFVDPATADAPVATLRTISDSERRRIESAEYGKTHDDDSRASVIERLREHAALQPDVIAIRDDRDAISYRDVDERSDRVAAALIRDGVRPQSLVAVEMPRSIDPIIAILGIWKAGAAYVPLERNLPGQRRDQIMADAAPSTVIDQARFDAWTQTTVQTKVAPGTPPQLAASDVAYVMYTSGSTGKPKGVAVTHGSLANLFTSFADEPGFSARDSMLAVTTLSFDISVLEMFLPLWCGGHVRMTAHRIGDDPESVIDVIERSRPTVIQSTPSAFRMLWSAGWRPTPATRLLCGGEPLLPDLASDLLATDCELWNVYGPTETTVWSTIKRIGSADNITIGHPIAGTICRVVNRHGEPVPMDVAGELQIGGVGVARGYWHDEPQTRERFFTDAGTPFYKTGDQVRRRSHGDLEFLARNDRQVKLRGFRIELDEIESMLQQCEGVDRAAVVLRDGPAPGGSRVIAFCCGAGDADSTRTQLARSLPDYMIPTTIAWLASVPQTAAGKTDYKSLPTESQALPQPTSEPPQTPMEIALAEMWCEVLGCAAVGRHDHFFDLGGNSLMAARLFARLQQRFDVQLPLREVYSRPTIAALAEAIVNHRAETDADDINILLGQLDALSDDEVIRALDETTSS